MGGSILQVWEIPPNSLELTEIKITDGRSGKKFCLDARSIDEPGQSFAQNSTIIIFSKIQFWVLDSVVIWECNQKRSQKWRIATQVAGSGHFEVDGDTGAALTPTTIYIHLFIS